MNVKCTEEFSLSFLQMIQQYALQLAVTVGLIVLIGAVISVSKRLFLKCCKGGAYRVELVTGLVGTPIHELSHAFFCLVFGHKITRICLWTPTPQNGNIGYVTHSYKKRNLWHQIGNFFIGVAPIIGGSAVLYLLLWLLLPETAEALLGGAITLPQDLREIPKGFFDTARSVILRLFAPANFLRFHWYLYFFFALPIVLHMEISRSDLRSGLWGFSFLALLCFFSDLALFFFYPEGLLSVTSVMVSVGAFLSVFLCLSALLSVLLLLISAVAALFGRR